MIIDVSVPPSGASLASVLAGTRPVPVFSDAGLTASVTLPYALPASGQVTLYASVTESVTLTVTNAAGGLVSAATAAPSPSVVDVVFRCERQGNDKSFAAEQSDTLLASANGPTVETTAALSAGATFTGSPRDSQAIALVSPTYNVAAVADAAFTLTIQQSANGVSGWSDAASASSATVGSLQTAALTNVATARYQRVKIVCGGTGMTSLGCSSQLGTIVPVGPAGATGPAGTPLSPDIQLFTANGTWTKPANAKTVYVTAIGAGGPGGSGRRGAAASVRCGGGAGGAGGTTTAWLRAVDLPSTVGVTVAGATAGGAAVAVNDTNGNNGATVASDTLFGAYVRAAKGSPGQGGTNATGTAGNGGTGAWTGGNGGAASTTGASGSSGNGGTFGAAGGGAGGGITSADAASAGGLGGASQCVDNAQATAGVVGGATPGNGSTNPAGEPSGGGGGGAASITGAAQAGGNGGTYGGGGGGGGASLNGNNSGAGGNGGPGCCLVITYF